MKRISTALVLAVLVLSTACRNARVEREARLAGALALRLQAEQQRTGVSGYGAGWVLPGGDAFGVVIGDDAAGVALTPASRFMSGSIGKTYCAAIALQLVAEGALDLDGKVQDVLGHHDWYARIPNASAITLRQLLNHTAGIREHVWHPEFQQAVVAGGDQGLTPVECLAFVLDDAPLFAAGERFAYADTNYLLVGLCIEAVTGDSFWSVLPQRLLRPLELDETGGNTGRELPGLVCGLGSGVAFHTGPTSTNGRYFTNPIFEYCGGGVHSTPRDLARWVRELFAGAVIPASLRDDHRRAVATGRSVGGGYGLGCFVGASPHGEALGHSGIMPGFLSYALWFPELEIAIAVQVPSDAVRQVGDLRELCCDLAGIAAQLGGVAR